MKIDDDLKRPVLDSSLDAYPHPFGELHVEAVVAHPDIDVAIVRVSGASGAKMDAANGLAWREPVWSDELTVLGYPSVPTSLGAYLTVQRGEVVNPRVVTGAGEACLFSATARPGNSGGPVIGRDGRLLGIVTHEPNTPASTDDNADIDDDEPDSKEQTDDNPAALPKRTKAAPFYAGVPSTVVAQALADINFGHLVRLETWE